MMGRMRISPLNKVHERLGARMVQADGWSMPRTFSSLFEEHLAARQACAVFDISSISKFRIRGNGAQSWLSSVLSPAVESCRDAASVRATLMDGEGKAVDEVALLRESGGNFLLLGHAGQSGQVAAWLKARRAHLAPEIRDETDEWCAMALMGPQCEQVLARVLRGMELPTQGRFSRFSYQSHELILSRLSLDGETEPECTYEFLCPSLSGISWFESFIGAGAQPCGSATRESLRMERLSSK